MKTLVLSLFAFASLCTANVIGLNKGDAVPVKTLMDIEGKTIDLSQKNKKFVLIFYRGSWCPYCMAQLKSVQKEVMGKIGNGPQLIAISSDRRKVAAKMKERFDFTFRVVSDPRVKLMKSFKIANILDAKLVEKYKNSYKIDVEADSGETHHIVAHPAVFIIENGKIIYADVHENYKDRTKNSEILKSLSL